MSTGQSESGAPVDDLAVVRDPEPSQSDEAEVAAYVAAKRATQDVTTPEARPAVRPLGDALVALRARMAGRDPGVARVFAQAAAQPVEVVRAARDEDRARDRAQTAQETHELRRRNLRGAFERARPLRYADARFDQLHPQQDPGGKVRAFATAHGPGRPQTLLLAGPSDKGKTHVAWALLNAMAETLSDDYDLIPSLPGDFLPDIQAWRATDLADALHFSRDPDGELLRKIQTCDLLFLDDLLNRRGTDWWADIVYQLFDHRASNRRRTIITMNVRAQGELADALDATFGMLGSPIMSRIREDCSAVWIDGQDMRTWAGHAHPTEGLFDG